MRTSLIETQRIEELLSGTGDPNDRLLTHAQSLVDPVLGQRIEHQRQSVQVIRHYGRQLLREEIAATESQIFTTKKYRSFQQMIRTLFQK